MDSLTTIHARLRELIDAKIERKQGLIEEIAAIDQELTEAKRLLNQWNDGTSSPPVLVPAIAETSTPKKAPKPKEAVEMPRDVVLAFIRDKGGPVHWREVLDHLKIQDGRMSIALRHWAKGGHLVNLGSGFFNVPAAPAKISA
jgi:hypothetical protein